MVMANAIATLEVADGLLYVRAECGPKMQAEFDKLKEEVVAIRQLLEDLLV